MTRFKSIHNKVRKNREFAPVVRSKNSNKQLQDAMKKSGITFPQRVSIMFGSRYQYTDGHKRLILNSVQATDNASDKFRMKACFNRDKVITAEAFTFNITNGTFHKLNASNPNNLSTDLRGKDTLLSKKQLEEIGAPFIGKVRKGSKGLGIVLFETVDELETFCTNFQQFKDHEDMGIKDTNIGIGGYLFEKYHNYLREYRIHVSENGVIYTNRKMLKSDTHEDERFYRNDSNSVWYTEDNPAFDRPVNWDKIVNESKKSLKAVGLDIGAVDVRVQGSMYKGNKRKDPKFFIVEINSSPSFGDGTLKAYVEAMPEIINSKL